MAKHPSQTVRPLQVVKVIRTVYAVVRYGTCTQLLGVYGIESEAAQAARGHGNGATVEFREVYFEEVW